MRRCRIPAALVLMMVLRGAYCENSAPVAPNENSKEDPVDDSKRGGHRHTNALAKETSPYLLQHAHNPVNWYAWNDEAFEKARKEEKPIFLSVGYSSCHWCHVMERESFENEDVAKLLNDSFISIKVDREERPDVDEIYMTVVQIYSQNGGWPMTVFMTPEAKPFFGGTYFPPEDRYGRIGFKRLLKSVSDLWKDRRKDVLNDSERLAQAVHEMLAQRRVPKEGELDITLLKDCVDQLHQNLDPTHGGFGTRPKFPPNNGLPLLLKLDEANLPETTKAVTKAKKISTLTFDQMALGGIHDQVAGGFHRYSTDDRWLVPHFEKMLYDNALLSKSYAVAGKLWSNPEYQRVARDIYDWVLREMTSPEGGFYSSLDADSEGEEGKFYVWDRKEIDSILGADSELFCSIFNVHAEGNFKEEASGHDTGLNILHLTKPLSEHAAQLKMSEAELRKKVDECKAKLLAVRVKRVWPGLDDKVLTSWNGLMIASLARGSVALNEPRYRDAAVKAADFLLKNLRTPDGRWLATHRKGQSKLPAYLDDHAFMAVAFLELFDATKDERWKNEAIKIVEVMDKHFADKERGGYFFTADDHEKLLARTKDPVDKAIPSGNGWSAIALVRLAAITGDQAYNQKALRIFEEFQGLMERAPQATESLLEAFAIYLQTNQTPEKPETITDAPSATRESVSVELLASQSALKRGAKVPIAVRFKIDKGWHLQVLAPDESTVGLSLSLKSRHLGDLDTPSFPEPETLKAPELGGELKVYSGTTTVGVALNVDDDAPIGKHALALKVRFQACNDQVCQKPEEVLLSLPIDVVDEKASVKATNKDVFDKLKLTSDK